MECWKTIFNGFLWGADVGNKAEGILYTEVVENGTATKLKGQGYTVLKQVLQNTIVLKRFTCMVYRISKIQKTRRYV